LALQIGFIDPIAIEQAELADARYNAAGEPRPPAPTISTRAALRVSWPATPISASLRWRL
jgi:hypothetical protein